MLPGTTTTVEDGASEISDSSIESHDSVEEEAAEHVEADLCFEVQCRAQRNPQDVVEMDIVRKRCLELRQHMRERPDLPCKSGPQPLSTADIDMGMKVNLYSCPFREGNY